MGFWSGKRVFLTGHTGFKGAWTLAWLHQLGVNVAGYSLPAEDGSLFAALDMKKLCSEHIEADLADLAKLRSSISTFKPDIVIHMAAQSLVRRSYREPLATIAANVTGTAHVLEACRNVPSIKTALVVTTDKCYDNKETGQAYKETDVLGGRDIYSASKAAAEIIAHSYRQSFFDADQIRICTARAGNVIGGGDVCEDRLLPDAVRAFSRGEALVIRSPKSLRPWQHVSEPVTGYLMLTRAMFENKQPLSPAYNFGPEMDSVVSVEDVISRFATYWPNAKWSIDTPKNMPHEAGLLALDASLAKKELGWKPLLTLDTALKATADGYQTTDKARHITGMLPAHLSS